MGIKKKKLQERHTLTSIADIKGGGNGNNWKTPD